MSYLRKTEYEIVPEGSFPVIRDCPGCGRKTYFKNTEKFRINANGNKLDIWLIYQCERCRHTLNLSIYERQRASSIPREEYQRFLDNDPLLAGMYGKSISFFKKNKAEIDFEVSGYTFVRLREITEKSDSKDQTILTIQNPHQLKIRPEKQIAGALGLSRSQVRKLMEQGIIKIEASLPQSISVLMDGIL